MFYEAVLPMFTSFSKFFQWETPCIHLVCDKPDSFVNGLLGKFVLSEMQRMKAMLLILTFIPMWINCLIQLYRFHLTIASEMELLQEEFIHQLLHDTVIPPREYGMKLKLVKMRMFTVVLTFSGNIFVRCKHAVDSSKLKFQRLMQVTSQSGVGDSSFSAHPLSLPFSVCSWTIK